MKVGRAMLLATLVTGAAQAQMITFGAAGTVTTEINPASRPGSSTLSNNTVTPALFVGFPILDDTMVRLRAIDLPHEQLVGSTVYDSRLHGFTVGVDYMLLSYFGRTLFSGGIGGYQLDIRSSNPPPGVEGWDFGWYVGVGEWFPMSKATRLTIELTYNATSHPDNPQIVALSFGLAVSL
jgi:hypothetical protein